MPEEHVQMHVVSKFMQEYRVLCPILNILLTVLSMHSMNQTSCSFLTNVKDGHQKPMRGIMCLGRNVSQIKIENTIEI